MQGELLHSPVDHFGYVEFIVVATIHGIDVAEFLHHSSRFAKFPEDLPVQIHFVDFARNVDVIRGI